MDEGQNALLARIWEELKGVREDFRCLSAKHDDVLGDVIRLKEDRANRDKLAATRTTYVCAFGAVVLTAIVGLVAMVYDNRARLDSINSYGTAFGRGRDDAYGARFGEIERRLPKEPSR